MTDWDDPTVHIHRWEVIPDGVWRTYECVTCSPEDYPAFVAPEDLIPVWIGDREERKL